MLRVRQVIPPLTLLTGEGKTIRAWDFKHKKNLVIGFLDAGCTLCEAFMRSLSARAAELREKEAVALLVLPAESALTMSSSLPPEIVVGTDIGNQSIRRFLSETETLAPHINRGVFATDRYGEISALWMVPRHEFPAISEILGSIDLVEIACEECFPPHWPAEA